MTNLVVELMTVATLATNWTGYTLNGKECGVLVTNSEARLNYEGTHNVVPLKTDLSGIAVWRTLPPPPANFFLTNVGSGMTTWGFKDKILDPKTLSWIQNTNIIIETK